jgi:hypothetical protein
MLLLNSCRLSPPSALQLQEYEKDREAICHAHNTADGTRGRLQYMHELNLQLLLHESHQRSQTSHKDFRGTDQQYYLVPILRTG